MECESEKPQDLRIEISPNQRGSLLGSTVGAEEFPGGVKGWWTRGRQLGRTGSEKLFCFSLSKVAKL
jgi:hypothetical protein